jgi:hypothetical protein
LTYHLTSPTINGMKRKQIIIAIVGGVIVLLLVVIGILTWKYQQVSKNPDNAAKKTSARVVDKVSGLYIVPTGEEPTVAQIQDKNKLDNQEFFKSAKNGDYLLIYQKARVALVYREDVNKLVNVGPVNIGADESETPGQAAGAQTGTTEP